MAAARIDPGGRGRDGQCGRGAADIKYVVPMLDDYVHAGDGEIAEILRPMYLEYLSKHE